MESPSASGAAISRMAACAPCSADGSSKEWSRGSKEGFTRNLTMGRCSHPSPASPAIAANRRQSPASPPSLHCYNVTCCVKASLTSSLRHPKKNRSSITPQWECKILSDFLYRAARFVRFLVEWYKSAISSAFPPVSPKVKIKMLIIIYLQGLLQKAAKSGRM